MRLLIVLVASLLTTACFADEPAKHPLKIPTPEGWRTETIALPPAFAKEMTWKGVEELRFAPGMFKPTADDFFSYVLVFWLADDQKIDQATMEKELLAYYRGLATAVLTGKNQTTDVGKFTLALKPAKAEKRASGEAVTAFTGELQWIEPFASVKPQTLRFDIHIWPCAAQKHHCLVACVSPQAESAAVWKSMREIRAGVAGP